MPEIKVGQRVRVVKSWSIDEPVEQRVHLLPNREFVVSEVVDAANGRFYSSFGLWQDGFAFAEKELELVK